MVGQIDTRAESASQNVSGETLGRTDAGLLHQFNAVLETIEYAVLFMGPDLRSRIINRAFKKMWGISDEFIHTTRPTMADLVRYVHNNHHLYDIPESEFEAFLDRRVEAVIKGSFSTEMRLRDGRVIHFQIQSLPDGGRLLTYFDITELKRNEEAAKQAKQVAEVALSERGALLDQFNAVLETIEYAVLFMGPDLRSRIINRAFKKMWGISDEFIHTTRPTMADLVRYVHNNHHLYDIPESEFEAFLDRRVEAVIKGSFSTEMRLRDGRVIHFQIQSLPDGGRLLTYFDITELKRNEEAAKQAKEAAEVALAELKFAQQRLIQTEKLASLGQLTAGIAHEIKNPLNFINNFSEVSLELLDEIREGLGANAAIDEKSEVVELTNLVRANLEKVQQHGRRADGIVKSMLMHSRESSGEWRAADINSIVNDSLSLAYYGNRSEQECLVALHKSLDPTAGAVEMFPQDIDSRTSEHCFERHLCGAEAKSKAVCDDFRAGAYDHHQKCRGGRRGHHSRQWRGYRSGDQRQDFQPIFYYEAAGRRYRTWALADPRHNCQATRGDDRFRYPAKRVHRVQGDRSAYCGQANACLIRSAVVIL